MTKGKPESNHSKMPNYSPDLSPFMPDNEFVELLWENGQIVMQGQSNRPRKSSFPAAFSSQTGSRVQEKENNHKLGRFGPPDLIVNDSLPSVPSAPNGLNLQDDDMAPWMNYPIEDPLQSDYCSEFLSEFSGGNLNSLGSNNSVMPTDRSGGFSLARDSQIPEHEHTPKSVAGNTDASRSRTCGLFQLPQQCQVSAPISKAKTSEFGTGSSTSTFQVPSGDLLSSRFQKQYVAASKPVPQSSGLGLMNFSHFSRPVALVKANLQSVDRLRSSEKVSAATSSNPLESTVVQSGSGLKSVTAIQDRPASGPKLETRSPLKALQGMVSVDQSGAFKDKDASRDNDNNIRNANSRPLDIVNRQNSTFSACIALGTKEVAKAPEAAVASSVCSGNSAGEASNDPKQRAKRKSREGEESEYHSEDLEDESVGVKKPAKGRGMSLKRSRAAEVHNLSERRRRDRINERMRALQELIPNCNKVDKASMLDEAIEYLKTLQLQVQIMSMGNGLCMPQMMLPPGMQHIRAPAMAHYAPMGVGMGMGYGVGMLDMNSSHGCPLIPVPSAHGSPFTFPSMPGGTGLHGVPGSTSLQMFGMPGQGLPIPMPRASPYGSFTGFSTMGNLAHEMSGPRTVPIPAPAPAADTAPSSSKDQQQQNGNLEASQKRKAIGTRIQTPRQAANEGLGESNAVQKIDDETLRARKNGSGGSTREDASAVT